MQNSSGRDTKFGLLITLFTLGLVTALIFIPSQFRSEAGATGEGLVTRTNSADPSLPNYDIRTAKEVGLDEFFSSARQAVGKDAALIADVRDGFVRGEEDLRSRIPTVKVEYNEDIRTPEVISPDVWKANIEWLTPASSLRRAEILRNFLKENNSLAGVDDAQADALRVTADYTNPDGNISYAHLEQRINGVPVFRGEVKAGFTKDGRIIRVINNLAPGLDYEGLSTDFRDPADALKAAARHINVELPSAELARSDASSTNLKSVFGRGGDWAPTAEKMYFPTEPGVAVTAWRVLIWQPVNAYYVIVDAASGKMLWRKNITEDQTQAATYNVYRNSNAYIDVADSPAPLSPGPIDPTLGTQGAIIPRQNVTLIGNEGTNSFNNNGWITDATNFTDGNAVEAGVDRIAPNGNDLPLPAGSPNRVFDAPTWNPPPGSPAPGDDPLLATSQRGAVTQMFYVMNRFHDELYKRGFTEAAFNFQNDNFGRGGVGLDRVSAEGQDSSGTNNANFSTPADGGRGRMQMFIWTGPTPDYDGTVDAEVIIHEVVHGLSNRLHGNTAGLSTNMARGMGEGWSDFYSYAMLAEPGEPVNSIYTTGGYATHLAAAGFTGNYYYGIRRFPRAPLTFNGANGRPHNPFTFRYLNAGCGPLVDGSQSAFPRGPFGVAQCDQVHNAGEVWSSMLWEVRNRMVARLGFTAGTTRALQVVTDGMKLSATGPTFIQSRDAIIAAAGALPGTEASLDVIDVREGFRVRGMGFSASIQAASPAAVTEAFDVPNAIIANPITVSDSGGDNDGFPEPGESLVVTVPISNSSGSAIANVNGSITGGGSASYGSIADGATVVRNIAYTVPAGAACGSMHDITITGTSALGALNPRIHSFRLGAPVGGAPVTFTNSTALLIPGTGTGPGASAPYGTTVVTSGLSGNKVVKLELTGLSHTFPSDIDVLLVGPAGQKFIALSDAAGGLDAVNQTTLLVDTAAAVLPAGDSTMAGTFRPTNHPLASDPFAAPAPAAPYLTPAPGGTDTFASAFGTAGSALNGTWTLYVMDDAGVDIGEIDGWKLTFEANDYECIVNPTAARARADFDGDGRTDLSVYRPSEGNWYLNRSTAGFAVINWGVSTDTLVPGDYDGDLKTDTAVFRANADSSQPDFFILNSNGFTVSGVSWGVAGDLPQSGDYDGDGKTDVAVYRPSTQTWFVLRSNGGITVENFGTTGDIPLVINHDGDARDNLAVFRPSNNTWYIARSTGVPATNFDSVPFGQAGDVLVPADYVGDEKVDIAVFRPSTGAWFIRDSNTGAASVVNFGSSGDIPVPGDYDGDGKDDTAIYRNGQWWLNRTTAGVIVQNFGLASDTAIPRRYLP